MKIQNLVISVVIVGILFGGVVGLLVAGEKILGKDANDAFIVTLKDFFSHNTKEADKDIDTSPLEVIAEDTELTFIENFGSVVLSSNKPISIEESPRFNLVLVEEKESVYWYVLEFKNLAPDNSSVLARFTDEADQEATITFSITKQSTLLPFGADKIEAWPDTQYVINGDDLLAPVNKSNRLTSAYAPTDLVNVNEDLLLYTDLPDTTIRKEAGDALKAMLLDVQAQKGIDLIVRSGYRSYNTQVQVYSGNVQAYGQEAADDVSARPGYSEHQLGTTVDFVSYETDYEFTQEYGNTESGKWLAENSWKYGFVLSYPDGGKELTGYEYEPWHFRYIGRDHAKEMHESGMNFPEWMEARAQGGE